MVHRRNAHALLARALAVRPRVGQATRPRFRFGVLGVGPEERGGDPGVVTFRVELQEHRVLVKPAASSTRQIIVCTCGDGCDTLGGEAND